MLSDVPLYIFFGANAKKMMTWQFDTAKITIIIVVLIHFLVSEV